MNEKILWIGTRSEFEILSDALNQVDFGYVSDVADSAQSGLNKIAQNKKGYDLIFISNIMEDIGAFFLIHKIKAIRSDIRFCLMVEEGDLKEKEKCQYEGIGYLPVHTDAASLVQWIENVIH